jgi:hypothetical protein
MKLTKLTTKLAAAALALTALTNQADAALTLVFTENANGTTTVTLTATNFTLVGLTNSSVGGNISTIINPSSGQVAFSGPTDVSTAITQGYVIPTFTYGTGVADTAATLLGSSNPFFSFQGNVGFIGLYQGHESDDFSNFVGTATYSGTLVENGISTTPQTITFANGQELTITAQPVPEPSAFLLGLGSLAGLVIRRRR